MSRYIVELIQTIYGVTYAVKDTATNKKVTQYGCNLWAQHRADELNRTEPPKIDIDAEGDTNGHETE